MAQAKKAAKKTTKKKAAKAAPAAAAQNDPPAPDAGAIVPKGLAGELALPADIHPDIKQRFEDFRESMETFENLKLPVVKFTNDGFEMLDGSVVEEFTGVMIYTKAANVYYDKPYKAGQNLVPTCSAPDGMRPTQGEDPQHSHCRTCPHNQFGSSQTGEGKACKNTRPTFFLIGGSIAPAVLRVPPTSLKNIQKYVMNVATNFGSYFAVRTKVSVYKEDEAQTYLNIKFQTAGPVPGECIKDDDGFISQLGRTEIRFLRDQAMPVMKEGNFGIDEESVSTPVDHPDAPPPAEDGDPGAEAEPQF